MSAIPGLRRVRCGSYCLRYRSDQRLVVAGQ